MRTSLLIPLAASLILPLTTTLSQTVALVTGVVSNWVSHDALPTPDPEPYNGGTTWYSGNGEAKSWGPAAQDLRGRQPPSEILFRTKLQDGGMSRGFKVVIP
jgi:hypothetical protein